MKLEILMGGEPLRQIQHEGRTFVLVPEAGPYAIRITGEMQAARIYSAVKAATRAKAVITVDGRNIIDGEPGAYDGYGYMVEGTQSYTIEGWRGDTGKGNRFSFGEEELGYNARMGQSTSNDGVIGVAVMREKRVRIQQPAPRYNFISEGPHGNPIRAQGTLASAPTAASLGEEPLAQKASGRLTRSRKSLKKMSTGFGEEVEMHTREVTGYKFEQKPAQVLQVTYGSREQLEEWGVPVPPPLPDFDAFPGSKSVRVPAPPPLRK